MKSIKAIFRRGQNAKIDGQNLPDNLSRTSSITNLDAEQKINKGAKPRKSASRDRIDKIGENKKNDKKSITKNNNKLESGDSPYPSIDSLQEEEFVQLRRQLQEMAQEKSNLALQLGEQKGQLNILQNEIQKLKCFQDESNTQLEHLTEENTLLRNRLRNVAHSPLSDNEKQQLLFETHRHHSSSAPASIATNLIDDGNGGDITACPTPDWDKHSSGNVSEVSVACLQDKINQMQETHYSTNEELQATLQELTDLQRQLTELQQENERLNEEKTLMFDSLCRQTERLNDSRSEVESLKQLLYREKDESGQYESAVEREQKLVDLLKSAQEERESLLVKLEQITNEVQEARAGIVEKDERILQLSNRVRTLESTLDAKHAEHKLMDQELAQAKDQCSGKQIEINRLTDLLDNARTKISELEQDRELSDKSELDELLDNARKEKDALESEVAHLKEQLAISKNETEKLREQVSVLQEECKVTRNNARTKQSDLEYKCEKLLLEKNDLSDQLQEFQEAVNELQVQSQCQLEDKRQLSAVLSETQRNLSEAERRNLNLENELEDLKKLRADENEEWEKFQNDLLTSVRVANDFKTEAQQELQRMIMENKTYRERERQLKAELDKLKGDKTKKGELSTTNSSIKSRISGKEKYSDTEMDSFFKLSRKSKDKPRKSKESTETSSSNSKVDKGLDNKPDLLKKFVKKREKQVTKTRKNKTLSVEEELLLKSLNDWYENIDKNISEENLTEEEKVVKKLKTLYEDDNLKERPVAHKPKNQLAISKPLLDSVFLNPKLVEIVNNPNMPTIEEMGNFEILNSDIEGPELRNLPDKVDRQAKGRSETLGKLEESRRLSVIGRSKSFDDLYSLDEAEGSPSLYRCAETEDLRKDVHLKQVGRESSILPSDSASNPRYSDFTVVVNELGKHKEPTKNPHVTKVTRKSSVNFETLEKIVSSIPNNAPEHELTSEQKFALRLKKSLDEAERKNTLKKLAKTKILIISSPTIESVQRNSRLRNILLDPDIKSVKRRNSDVQIQSTVPLSRDAIRQSKSHEDIAFTFDNDPNNRTSGKYSCGSAIDGNNPELKLKKISSTESFSSGEFNVETGLTGPYNSRALKNLKENKLSTLYNLKEDAKSKQIEEAEFDSLVYNETLNKKQEFRIEKENGVSYFIKQDLEYNKMPEILIEDFDGNKNISELHENVDDRDFDLLYNETLKKALELRKQLAVMESKRPSRLQKEDMNRDNKYNEIPIKITQSQSSEKIINKDEGSNIETSEENTYQEVMGLPRRVSEDSDLGYFETLNKNVVSHQITKDKDFDNMKSMNYHLISKTIQHLNYENEHYDSKLNEELNIIATPLKMEEVDSKVVNFDIEDSGYVDNAIKDDTDSIKNDNTAITPISDVCEDGKTFSKNTYYGKDGNSFKSLEIIVPEAQETHTSITENISTFKGYEEISSEFTVPKESAEYDYHAILKENRYGVISPLNVRLTYKDVVKEIKHKFPENQETSEIEEDEDVGLEQRDTFFDEFFAKHKERETVNSSPEVTDNINNIDKEMEEIFEKYLHTPLSKIITQIEESEEADMKIEDKTELSDNNLSENLSSKFADKDFTLADKDKIDVVEDETSTSEPSLEEIILIIDDNQTNLNEKEHGTKGTDLYSNELPKDSENIKEGYIDQSMLSIDDNPKDLKQTKEEINSGTGKEIKELIIDDNNGKGQNELKRTKRDTSTDEDRVEEQKNVEFSLLEVIDDDQKDLKPNVETTEVIGKTIDIHTMKNDVVEMEKDIHLYTPEVDETDQLLVPGTISSCNLDQELVLTEKIEERDLPDIIESVNKDVSNVIDSDLEKSQLKSKEMLVTNLTPEELDLVRSIQTDRFSRPLSDFNEEDLRRIQEISAHYNPEKENQEKYFEIPEREFVSMAVGNPGENPRKIDDNLKRQNQKESANTEDTEETIKVDLSVSDDKLADEMQENEVKASDVTDVFMQTKDDEIIDLMTKDVVHTHTDDNLQLDKKNKEEQKISVDQSCINIVDKSPVRTALGEIKEENIIETEHKEDSDLDNMLMGIVAPRDILTRRNKNKGNGDDEMSDLNVQSRLNHGTQIEDTEENETKVEHKEAKLGLDSTVADGLISKSPSVDNNVAFINKENIDLVDDTNARKHSLEEIVLVIDDNQIDLIPEVTKSEVPKDALIENNEFIDHKLEQNKDIMHDDLALCKENNAESGGKHTLFVDHKGNYSDATIEPTVVSNTILQQTEVIEDLVDALTPTNISIENIKSGEVADPKMQNKEDMPKYGNLLQDKESSDKEETKMFVELSEESNRGPSDARKIHIVSNELNKEKQENVKMSKSEGNDDLDILLARMTAPKHISLRSKDNKDTRDGNIKFSSSSRGVVFRERSKTKDFLKNYGGVSSKLEYFSKSTEDPPSTRKSFTTYPDRAMSDRRKVKSWAEHFEKRSLDTHTSYEPVYANFKMISTSKNQPLGTSKIEKKPLPVPRSNYQGSQLSRKNLDRAEPIVKVDNEYLKHTKMSDLKIFSESKSENVPQEIPSVDVSPVGKFEPPEIPGHYEYPKSLLEEVVTQQTEEEEKQKKKLLAIKKSEKFLGKMHRPSEDDIKIMREDCQNLASGAEYSYSSIAVAGKSEQLDITKHIEEDEMEQIDNNNESNLNLFHLETPSYDESYLSLFKSPEDKVYEDISGQRKSQRGYFNIAYLGEVSDNESLDDLSRHDIDNRKLLKEKESKPRIIDFVPLDDATEPVFNKNDLNIPEYNTLEREKAYHVLNTAASNAKVRISVARIHEAKESQMSLPSLPSLPNVPSGSRTSFSAAKKVFEALLEQNLEKPKLKKKEKKPKLKNENPDNIEMNSSISSVEVVEEEKITRGDN